MIDRNESLRDQIATIVQAGYSQRKTSVETADEILTRLERELAEAKSALELGQINCDAAYDYLRAELAEAKKDTARLNWLADVNTKTGWVMLSRPIIEANMHCMRAAIDAAMEGDK